MLSCMGFTWAFSLMYLKEEEQVVVKKMLWSRHCGKSDCWNERENLQEEVQLFGSVFGVAVCHFLKQNKQTNPPKRQR